MKKPEERWEEDNYVLIYDFKSRPRGLEPAMVINLYNSYGLVSYDSSLGGRRPFVFPKLAKDMQLKDFAKLSRKQKDDIIQAGELLKQQIENDRKK